MSITESDKPKIEPAKSGRSKCRECQEKIQKDILRVGIPYPFTTPKGEVITSYRYYHLECTPSYSIPDVISALKEKPLEDDDQQNEILEQLKQKFEKSPSKGSRSGPRRSYPFIERSKSSRGKCKQCDMKIEKSELRVAEPTLVELDDDRKFTSNHYFHINCYLQHSDNPEASLTDLIAKSTNTITEEEISTIKDQFSDLLSTDSSLKEVLALISIDPLQITTIQKYAKEKGVNFTLVEKAIERGLMRGTYFKPTPETVQKLT